MAKTLEDGLYQCSICKKTFNQILLAVSCEKGHNVVYVPLYRDDIIKFIQFLFTGDSKLLPDRMIRTLMEYTRTSENQHDMPDL